MMIFWKWSATLGTAIILLLCFAWFLPAQVTQISGLAVAQSNSKWNRLKDMAQGDTHTSGVALFTPCLFNGTSCDRQRGTIAGGAEVNVKSLSGGKTPADAFANPTDALNTWSLLGVFNGTTWDRLREPTADDVAVTGIPAAGLMKFDNTTWDRWRGGTHPVAGPGFFNCHTTGAANTAVTCSAGAAVGVNVHLYHVRAFCSGGTSTITVTDGGATVYATPAAAVGVAQFREDWSPGFTAQPNSAVVVTLGACGVGNTGTLTTNLDRW